MKADFLIKNANVIFTDEGIIKKQDLLVVSGSMYLTSETAVEADTIIEGQDLYLAPGFVDHHCHVFYGGSDLGFHPDSASFCQGLTAMVDAGSAGASNFKAFYQAAAASSLTKIYAYLNIASEGQIGEYRPEKISPKLFKKDKIADLIKQYPCIRGLKIRFDKSCVQDPGIWVLEAAKDLAMELKLPMAVHISNHPDRIEDILKVLTKGDLICHIYQNLCEGILDGNGSIQKAVLDAKEKGVIFESADGFGNCSFKVLKKAISQNFYPDVISTDLTAEKVFTNRGYGLIYTMSKYLAFGMSLIDIIKAVTLTPGRCLNLPAGLIGNGMTADLTLFKLEDAQDFYFTDYEGVTQPGTKFIVPLAVIAEGKLAYSSHEMIKEHRIIR